MSQRLTLAGLGLGLFLITGVLALAAQGRLGEVTGALFGSAPMHQPEEANGTASRDSQPRMGANPAPMGDVILPGDTNSGRGRSESFPVKPERVLAEQIVEELAQQLQEREKELDAREIRLEKREADIDFAKADLADQRTWLGTERAELEDERQRLESEWSRFRSEIRLVSVKELERSFAESIRTALNMAENGNPRPVRMFVEERWNSPEDRSSIEALGRLLSPRERGQLLTALESAELPNSRVAPGESMVVQILDAWSRVVVAGR